MRGKPVFGTDLESFAVNEEQENAEMLDRILVSPSYRPAYKDVEFLSSPELRPVRMELELLKPELALQQHGVQSTIVTFGSTRIVEPSVAEAQLEHAEPQRQPGQGL